MRSLRSRIKNKTNSKSGSKNYNEETEIYISSELPVTAVLDEKPISFSALQRSSDDIGEKCGEVFKNKDAIFSYLCTICGTLLDGIEEFKSHVKSHSSLCKLEESLDELPINIDQNLNYENLDVDQFNSENIFSKENNQEKDEVDEKPRRVKAENSTNSKRQETIKKRKCKKSKQAVSYEISNSSETDEESDITMRQRRRKHKRDNCDQIANDEVADITFKKEDDTNGDANKKDENVTDTAKKPKKKIIRKKKQERCNIFCKLCNKEFICQLYLDSHLKYDHIARNPFVNSNTENQPDSWSDDDLDRQTKIEQTINLNEKSNVIQELDKSISDDPFRCRYCDKRFKSRMNRYEHECLHTGEKPFKCETCGKTFRRKNVRDEHYITHTNEKRYKCEICNESYKHKKSLRTHNLRHKGEKPYKCKYCDRAFTQSGNRNTHERTHTNEKPFQCSDCGKCFGSNRELLIHSRSKHSLSKLHVCSYCGKAFAEIIDKKKHEIEGLFLCKVCNSKVNTTEEKRILEKSDKSIEPDPLKCQYCEKRLRSRTERFEHECKHTGEKPYTCETCGKTFRKKNVLDDHQITHTTEKPYKCEICNESYKHKSSLRTHYLYHKGEKPFKCKYCDRAFTQAGNRNTHERTHINEKPFQCSDCGICFGSNEKLLTHSRRKHSLSKPHVCSYCDKAFAEIIDKKKHEKVHVKGGSFTCKICNAKFSTYKSLRTHIKTHPELNDESKDQCPTLLSSTVSNDVKSESNESNEIATSSSTSLPLPNIIENVNENENDNQNQIQNPNTVNEKDKLLASWNSTIPNPFGIFNLSFSQYSQN